MAEYRIIKPSVERIDERDNLKRIEIAGRVCYKSESKITPGSAEAFCKRLLDSGHTSVLEHSNVIVRVPTKLGASIIDAIRYCEHKTKNLSYLRYSYTGQGEVVISGNIRAWKNVLDAFPYFCFGAHPLLDTHGHKDLGPYLITEDDLTDEERQIHSRITLRIVCDRGVSHELVRHRVMSFSQESTRYVNYGRRGYTFIEPWWWGCDGSPGGAIHNMHKVMRQCVDAYESMISAGASPQMARAVLPNQIKTEVVVTATPMQWREFLRLRDDKAAHPDMQRVAKLVREALGADVGRAGGEGG